MAVTLGVNNFSNNIFDGKITYAPDLTGAKPIKQGQLCCFDATLNNGAGGIRPLAAAGDAGTFVGVADQNSILAGLGEQLPTVVVGFKNIYFLPTTAGDVYKMGAPVYYNAGVADGQTITVTGGGSQVVGYALIDNESLMGGILSITGAAGRSIWVAVVGVFPVEAIA